MIVKIPPPPDNSFTHDSSLFLIWILTVVISGLVGYRLRDSFDAAAKRRRFRSIVEVLRRRIDARGYELITPQQRELPKLEAEILEVRHHIAKRLRTRFDDAIAAYKAVGFDTWAGPDEVRQEARDTHNEKARQTLLASLDELYACARWAV